MNVHLFLIWIKWFHSIQYMYSIWQKLVLLCLMYWSKIIYRLGWEKSPQTSLSLVNRENNVVVNGLHYFTKISASFIHSLPQWTTRSPKISSGLSLSYRGYGCKSEKCFCACTVFVSHLCMICFSLRLFFLQRGL